MTRESESGTIAAAAAKARDLARLLMDPDRWTRRHMAENPEGRATAPSSDDAIRWCILGGVMKVTGWDGTTRRLLVDALAAALPERLYVTDLASYNDYAEHRDVTTLIERVATRLEAEAAAAA